MIPFGKIPTLSRHHSPAALLACIFLCQSNSAADLKDLFDMSLEQLINLEISSAAKHPEKVADIPASVYIIPRQDIEQAGHQSLTEILRAVPGVYHLDSYDNDLLGIRGVVDTGFGDITMLINGVIQPSNLLKYLTVPPESIERIEFIRGPMSVIYGNGAFLGSINIVTNDSADRGQITTAVSTGGIHSHRAGVRWGHSSNNGRYNAHIYGDSSEGIDANYADMMSAEQLANIPAGAHTSTKNDLELENWGSLLTGQWKDIYGQLHYQHIEREAWVLTPSFDDGNREEVDIYSATIGSRQSLSDTLQLHSKFDYSKTDIYREFDFVTSTLKGDRSTKSERFELEANLLQQATKDLIFLWGANYRLYKDNNFQLTIPLFGLDETIDDGHIKTASAFFQANYHYSPALELVLGARHEQQFNYSKRVGGNGNLPTLALGKYEINDGNDSHLVPRAALIYKINENNIFKFMYGEAIKSSAEIASSTDAFEVLEEAKTIEINYLYSTQNALLSLSIYQNNNKNLARFFQTFTPTEGFQTIGTFSGELETYGTEIWAKLKPSDAISLDLSATYADVTDNDTNATVGNSPKLLYKISTSYLAPPFQYTVAARYTDSMHTDWNRINIDGSVNRIADRVDSNLVIDSHIRYLSPSKKFNLSFKIQNISNEDIYYPASENAPFNDGLLGPERSYIFSGTYFLD